MKVLSFLIIVQLLKMKAIVLSLTIIITTFIVYTYYKSIVSYVLYLYNENLIRIENKENKENTSETLEALVTIYWEKIVSLLWIILVVVIRPWS
jgi:hypothetical protein